MAAIANVALTNTFDSWRTRSNQSFTRLNQFAINESSLYANTLTANVAFVSKGLATMQGKALVGTNLVVTANTTTNKLTVTSNLAASGNVQLGDASTDIVNIRGKGNTFASFVVGKNLTVSGNTSIGPLTSYASANVVVSGATANPLVRINQSGTGAALYISTGKLGVGVVNPTYPIDTTGIIRTTSTSGIYSNQLLLQHDGTNAYIRPMNSGGGLYLGSNNQNRITISSAGLTTLTNSLTVGKNLIVQGNTTLGDSTSDRITITGTINTAGSNILSQTLTDGATITWNTASGQIATVTLAGNRTMAAPTNLRVGTYILRVYQDGIGSRTITWNSVFKWTAAVAPVLTTTAGALDVFSFYSDGTNLYGSYLPDMR